MFTTRKWWLLLVATLAFLSPSVAHADGMYSQNFTVAVAGPAINNIGTAIAFHQLTWNVVGTASVCTVALDTSADGITWSAGGAITGQTCTSNGTSTVTNHIVNYVRIHVTALTVTAGSRVNVAWNGYINNPGGGGGGSITSCTTNGGVLFENGTNNTATCGANLTWDATNSFLQTACDPNLAGPNTGDCVNSQLVGTITGSVGDTAAIEGDAIIAINSPNTTPDNFSGYTGGFEGGGSGTFTGFGAGIIGNAQYIGTGTLTNLVEVYAASGINNGGGTVTNNYGVYGGDQHGVASTLNAAFYAPDQGTGANDYAMYLAGGKLHSAGAIDSNSSISANSDGTHAGEIALLGQTTAPTIPANSFGFLGPNSASFTSWFIQPTSTAPAAQCMVSLGITASNISALTCPTLTPVANGGTALATLTAHALYVGNAASAPNAVSVGATGTVLAGATGADPAFTATPAVTSIATGTSPPTCTVGTAGALCENEGTAPTGASSVDDLYADSTGHCLTVLNQTANMGCALGILRATMTADWTCGTGGTVSSCTAATIVGSTGTPMTITLPSAALSWTFDCDGVVTDTTGTPANNWNLITATNGATNVTASFQQATTAALSAWGATTDQGSTTTTFSIGGTWTLGATATKMPFHIHARIEGASASGTVVSLQVVDPTVADLLTVYRGMSCWAHQ